MAQAFLHGGGGDNPLNFKVVGGTSAPSNPKANTIWVNTSTAITGYVFSAAQPTGSAGLVWIQTGFISSAPFNALKKNILQVYPATAKQYISGTWVDKTIKIYQSGAWMDCVETVSYLIKAGVAVSAFKTYNSGTGSLTVTVKDGYLQFGSSSTGYKSGYMTADLTFYNTLVVEGTFAASGDNYQLSVWPTSSINPMATNDVAGTNLGSSRAELDISSLTGEYFVGVTSVSSNYQKITDLYLKM